MRYLNTIFFVLVFITANAQNNFEKGKIETDNGKIINAYIGVYNWQTFPEKLEYKSEPNSNLTSISSTNINALYLDNGTKYFKKTVEIDKSSNNMDKLDDTFKIVSEVKTVFLRQLVDGIAKLYIYSGGEKTIFFFETPNHKLDQLIYKKYLIESSNINYNKTYLYQLKIFISCDNKQPKVSYTVGSLSKYFLKSNKCKGDLNATILNKQKFKINVNILVGVNYSNIIVDNYYIFGPNSGQFQNKISPQFGINIEGYLPSKAKNYISPYLSITNRTYHTKQQIRSVNFDIKYSGMEINPGIRYYYNLKDDTYIFGDLGVSFNYKTNESISSDIFNTSDDYSLFRTTQPKLNFGVGYKIDRLSLLLKYYFPMEFQGNYLVTLPLTDRGPINTKMSSINFQILYDLF